MYDLSTLRKHAGLLDDMAAAQGIDLEEAAFAGTITIPEIEDAVLRCASCTRPDACSVWLKAKENLASATPDYCRNTELFTNLKRGDQQ